MDLEGIIGEGVKFTEEEIAELFNNPFARERTNFIAWAQERIPLIARVYDVPQEDIKKVILSHPRFAGLNHERVVNEATDVYGEENRDRVKKSILSHPPFAGYNHERVVRQNSKLGKIIGLEKTEIIERILNNPVLSSYSVKRYIAGLDVCRVLQNEGFDKDKILYCYFGNISSSPYVPNHDRKRISQVENGEEPPLLIKMRKYLTKN